MKPTHIIVVALVIVCGCIRKQGIVPQPAVTRDDSIRNANRMAVVHARKNGSLVIDGEHIALSNLATRLTDAGLGPNCAISGLLPPGFTHVPDNRDRANLYFEPILPLNEMRELVEALKESGIGTGFRIGE